MLADWLKALHLIGVVCWFAGIFYLPRLFVYHTMAQDSVSIERFKLMERRLFRGIMTPSAVVAVTFGLWMMTLNWSYYLSALWFPLKLALVSILIAYHVYCGFIIRRFQRDENSRGHVFYRWFNEFPIIVLVCVVILAVVRPF
ncbi:MAG: protoporphyrinogen oxidase HemJ [Pseudomonadales bacterium]|jgi:putative membrane protein|nr:protoporphyrinogen oxidase HemJ [Gammaproteobacteria bacterium]